VNKINLEFNESEAREEFNEFDETVEYAGDMISFLEGAKYQHGIDLAKHQNVLVEMQSKINEMTFELDSKQRPLGEQVLNLTLENDALKKELDIVIKTGIEMQREVNRKLSVEITKIKEVNKELVEALEFECGNRCAEQNPCNAKEVLALIKGRMNG